MYLQNAEPYENIDDEPGYYDDDVDDFEDDDDEEYYHDEDDDDMDEEDRIPPVCFIALTLKRYALLNHVNVNERHL